MKETQQHAAATLARLKAIESRRRGVVRRALEGNPNWYGQVARDAAHRSALATLIAGLEVWQTSGNHPTALPLTVPPSIDPMTGGPLHFAKLPGGFKVWCIGTDGRDHGGKPYPRGTSRPAEEFDTAYSFWLPVPKPNTRPHTT